MNRRALACLLALLLLAVVGASMPSASTAAGPSGRFLISDGNGVDLFEPETGEVRRVAEDAAYPAFGPSGGTFAYIGGGGCYPSESSCRYTQYSVFEKPLSELDPMVAGRQIFDWTAFFVRRVDVSPQGRLIFSAKPGPGPEMDGKTLELYSAPLNGGSVRRLTENDVFDNDPVISPDGRHVAFARKVDGRGQVFTMRIGGGEVRRLTHDRRRNRLPSWSPDGSRLVFISQDGGQYVQREIHSVSARGGPVQRLTNNRISETYPHYSPDGRSIAFLARGDLWLAGVDGAEPHRLLVGLSIGGYEGGLDWAP